jgi:hypothetical protein
VAKKVQECCELKFPVVFVSKTALLRRWRGGLRGIYVHTYKLKLATFSSATTTSEAHYSTTLTGAVHPLFPVSFVLVISDCCVFCRQWGYILELHSLHGPPLRGPPCRDSRLKPTVNSPSPWPEYIISTCSNCSPFISGMNKYTYQRQRKLQTNHTHATLTPKTGFWGVPATIGAISPMIVLQILRVSAAIGGTGPVCCDSDGHLLRTDFKSE